MCTFGDIVDDSPDWEMIELVYATLDQLTPIAKTLIEMRFYHKYPYSKITALMGYSSKSVAHYNVRKSLMELRDILMLNKTVEEKYG